MARPALSLAELVVRGSFRASRHHPLLAGEPLPWPGFALLQERYRTASSDPERREIAREFARAVELVHEQTEAEQAAEDGTLELELAKLGKPGSVKQLLAFFPAFLRHAKGPLYGQPFQLERWQKAFLREFAKRDKKGRRLYSRAVLAVPRGNGKTPLAAGLALYELVRNADAPEVLLAAGSRDQAGIGVDFARGAVEQGPLQQWVRISRRTLTCPSRRGRLEGISAEGNLQHGRAPSAAILDELWTFQSRPQEETYNAIATSLHKRPDAFSLAITTAGYDRDSLLGRIYDDALRWDNVSVSRDGCLTIAKNPEAGALVWWYGAPVDAAVDDPRVLRACNPASWLSLADLQRQLHDPGLTEHDFRRLHLNQWTTVRELWLPDGCWQQLATEQQIPKRAEIFVGVDVGIYHDTTAVVWAHKLEDGRILLNAHVWSADPEAAAHTLCPGGRVELEQVEQFILQLARDYKLLEVAYDPYFFARSAELLEKANRRLTLIEFLQNAGPMADAYQGFYQAAREGRICHNNDPVLTSHINATVAQLTERGWKLRKLTKQQRMDATVAACLAHTRAVHAKQKGKPNVFWMENT